MLNYKSFNSEESYCKEIGFGLRTIRTCFIVIGYSLWCIREAGYTGNMTISDYAREKFGFSKGTTSKFIRICEKYSVKDDFGNPTSDILPEVKGFSFSQLSEMLYLDVDEEALVTPDMSFREIRSLKNSGNNSTKNEIIGVSPHNAISAPKLLPHDLNIPQKAENKESNIKNTPHDQPKIEHMTCFSPENNQLKKGRLKLNVKELTIEKLAGDFSAAFFKLYGFYDSYSDIAANFEAFASKPVFRSFISNFNGNSYEVNFDLSYGTCKFYNKDQFYTISRNMLLEIMNDYNELYKNQDKELLPEEPPDQIALPIIPDEKPAESKNSMLKSYEFQEIVKICFNEGDYAKLVSKVVDLYKKGNLVVVSSYKKVDK